MKKTTLNPATLDRTETRRGNRLVAFVGHHSRLLSLALLVALVMGFVPTDGSMVRPQEAEAAYSYSHTDSTAFWDYTGSRVYIQANVQWYQDWLSLKGVYGKDSYVVLNRQGCLWVKITWNQVTANVSWPPSGAANSVSGGYYRACGPKGTGVSLNGIMRASKGLVATTVCIGYSNYETYTLRRYDACQKMYGDL